MKGLKQIHLPYIIAIYLSVSLLFLATSCEDKHNCNGKLDGFWQLTSWVDNSDGHIVADNGSGIYYSVSLQLIKMSKPSGSIRYYLCTFNHIGDSLCLTHAYVSPFDSVVPYSSLREYGVADNGKFKIGKLDSKNLVLINDAGTLTFRRY